MSRSPKIVTHVVEDRDGNPFEVIINLTKIVIQLGESASTTVNLYNGAQAMSGAVRVRIRKRAKANDRAA